MSLLVTKGLGKSGETKIRLSDVDWSKTVIEKVFKVNKKNIIFKVNTVSKSFSLNRKFNTFNQKSFSTKFNSLEHHYTFKLSC